MAANTILINDVDPRTQTGVQIVGSMSSLLWPPFTLRGSNATIPGAHGQVGADLPVDAYTGDIQLQVLGSSIHAMMTNLQAFLSAIRGGTLSSLCTLVRKLDDGSGGYVTHTSPKGGQIVGNPVTTMGPNGRTTLSLVQLSGYWADGSTKLPY